jgi:hypothetical protein
VLHQLSISVKRQAAALFGDRFDARGAHDALPEHPVVARQAEIGSLRGVTAAAADVSECTCPESCERDHANE